MTETTVTETTGPMTESTGSMTETVGSMTQPPATLGQRLKAAREKKGLSTQKAADELHLDGWVVDALEGGDYLRIGPAVYAKGHLKRYAALLGLPAAEIVDAYDAQSANPAPGQTAGLRLGTASSTGSETPWAQMVGLAILAVIVAGVVWWKPWQAWQSIGRDAVPPSSAVGAAAGVPSGPSGGTETSGDAGAEAEDEVAAAPGPSTDTAPNPGVGPMRVGAAVPVTGNGSRAAAVGAAGTAVARGGGAGAGRARLRLSFSADAWVDVHDATGQRLYAGNGRANSVKTLSGEAPLRVYLKSAGGVQLQINDRAVAIGQQFVSGDSARFEAGADGVLRRESRAPAVASPMAKVASPHG